MINYVTVVSLKKFGIRKSIREGFFKCMLAHQTFGCLGTISDGTISLLAHILPPSPSQSKGNPPSQSVPVCCPWLQGQPSQRQLRDLAARRRCFHFFLFCSALWKSRDRTWHWLHWESTLWCCDRLQQGKQRFSLLILTPAKLRCLGRVQ